ncbi:kinase, pfkB family protein [Ketogulonicigenium robustum]|uniref:Kinase, pfkB family protein n=1 Tax=Ketogulonicigenium robustum TaxID=92947 RepID=A0A1W6NW67_9RHOB|nr:adenosine kinase [Ketogulonicigenium robustum]ARO13476.1 kinase, pfkB family protein [Ketogulonicigenium robustum]
MKTYAAVGLGNAIVDVLTQSDDTFLEMMGIEKGIMQLIERDRAELLYSAMQGRVQVPGGSVANTMAGLGNLGLNTAFVGRVHDDILGRFYADAMNEMGTDFVNSPVAAGDLPTSRCMIFVSPDGERSMNTYLGISSELGPDDLNKAVLEDCDLTYLEGYLYDKPKGKAALEEAARLCQAAGGRAGIALSDPFCADRHRGDFQRIARQLDYVLGNEHEWMSLYQCDLENALQRAAREVKLAVCTRGGGDVVLLRGDERVEVPVNPVTPVDATGAGDAFAAGFLFGLWNGRSLQDCGRMGCVVAAEAISHFGARPETDLQELFTREGLI